MINFAKTPMGRRFFERDVPGFIKALVDLMRAVDDNTQAAERNTTATKLSNLAANRGPTGVQAALDKLKTEGDTDNPLGIKPLKLDESDITSAPAEGKRRALLLALDGWIQTSPDDRARIVEALRHDDESIAGKRAGTVLALFVQFEDTVREALADESSCGEPQA